MRIVRFTGGHGAVLLLGFAFLYVPLVLVALFSFNASRLATVWGGFSVRPYVALLGNVALLDAAATSFAVALVSATMATVLGTLAALALVRHGRFPGRTLFTALVYAPLVMPEVVTGLALLLFFVAIGLDRGAGTVALSHATLTVSVVTVVVQSRLLTLDRSLEEAASDLGAGPVAVFRTVTLPLLAPAVTAGFLLAFVLSMDDVVVASFTSGPGATTLPMRIYSSVRLGVTPEINAVSTLIIAAVAVAVAGASLLFKLRRGRTAD